MDRCARWPGWWWNRSMRPEIGIRFILLLLLGSLSNNTHAQPQLWTVRHDNSGDQGGFGDVGLGLSLRHDSLLVGRSFNHVPALDLLTTDGSLLWSFAQFDSALFHGGSCFLGDGALLAYQCVINGGQGLRILGLDLDGPMLDWSHAFHDFEVDHVTPPVGGGAASNVWVAAAGEHNDSTFIHVMACERTAGVAMAQSIPMPHTVHELHASFIPGHGLLVDAMVQHPDAFTTVPWEALIDTSDLSVAWSTYLTDTTGFLVNATAITKPWAQDTLLTAITTWSGQLRLSFRSVITGQLLTENIDTLAITPMLGDLLVKDHAAYIATTNRFLLRYDDALQSQWGDTSYIYSYFPGMQLFAAPDGAVLVNGRKDGSTIGQDIEVTRFNGSDGAIATHFLFNDAVTNTHDILHATAVAGDTLFVLTAATFDTLNILNEHTELSVTAFLLDGTTHVAEPSTSGPARAVLTDHLIGVISCTSQTLVLTDSQGRTLAQGDLVALDIVFSNAEAGQYFVRDLATSSRIQIVVHP